MQLLHLLADGKTHSNEELTKALGITDRSIKKQLEELTQETGINIQYLENKGYYLESCFSLLDPKKIEPFIPWPICILNTTDSTNKQALEAITKNTRVPMIVTAEQQTAGRGRLGKQWLSPYGKNIYYSFILPIDKGIQQIEGLSLTVGLAVLQTLKRHGLSSAGLKWPNDVLVKNKKIAGILLELHGDPTKNAHVVIGIGLNVNMQMVSEHPTLMWTSLYNELGKIIDRNTLIVELTQSLDNYLKIHLKQGFSVLKEEWENNNLWQNKDVNLLQGDQQISGRMIGIDNTGALKLKLQNEIKYFNAGEVSLRLAPSSID